MRVTRGLGVNDHQHVTAKLRTFVPEWYDPGKNLFVCTLMTDWICETELRSRPKLGKKSQKSVLSRVECRNEGSDSIGGDYFLHAKSNWNKRRTIALIAWYDTMPQTWWSASQWSEIENSNLKLLWKKNKTCFVFQMVCRCFVDLKKMEVTLF